MKDVAQREGKFLTVGLIVLMGWVALVVITENPNKIDQPRTYEATE